MERSILLADMNSFFASVHQAIEPELRGRPVIVGGDPEKRHGIVLAASYEAKRFGVKTGQGIWEARRLCPRGIFVKPRYDLYVSFSSRILAIMREFTPLVEPFSIDEAFMDVTGCLKLFGSPLEIARELKRRILEKVGVSCSVGIGPNKLLAKMAADMEKPDGLTVLTHQDIPFLLWPLPVRELFGVGHRYGHHLNRLNIHTIGDLARFPVEILKSRFGVTGEILWLSANGVDYSPVNPASLNSAKSIGQQITLPRDCSGESVKTVIWELADLVGYRVRAGGYVGKTVALFLKDPNFQWISRMQTLPEPTNMSREIATGALELLKKHWSPDWPVRLVGVALTNLTHCRVRQPSLFGEKNKLARIEQACDRVWDRFGRRTVFRASSLTEKGISYVR